MSLAYETAKAAIWDERTKLYEEKERNAKRAKEIRAEIKQCDKIIAECEKGERMSFNSILNHPDFPDE